MALLTRAAPAPPVEDDDDTPLDVAESYTAEQPAPHTTDFRKLKLDLFALSPDPARTARVSALAWEFVRARVAEKVRPQLDALRAMERQYAIATGAATDRADADARALADLAERRAKATACSPVDLDALLAIDDEEQAVRRRRETADRSADLLAPLVAERREAAERAIDAALVGGVADDRQRALIGERSKLLKSVVAKIGPDLAKLLDLDAALVALAVPHHLAAQSVRHQLTA